MKKNKQRFNQLVAGLLLSLGLVAVSHAALVTSIKPLGFIAQAIADGVTPVEVVLPDGGSEHDYALRPSDVRRIKSADLLVWTGPEMEAFITRIAGQLPAEKNLKLAALPKVIEHLVADADANEDGEHQHAHHAVEKNSPHQEVSDSHSRHGQYNMHIWLSPDIALISATAIHDRLVTLMPEHKTQLDANLAQFTHSLSATDQRIKQQLAPVQHVGYFVFHDAYTYFEQHYGLSPRGYFTVNPEIQPGAQKLHEIRVELVEQKASCVFAEPQFRPAVIDAVTRGTQVHRGILDPLGTNISVSKDSYVKFLSQLSSQYASCLNQ